MREENHMPPDGIDTTLRFEAVYVSAPIPRNLGVLTVLGTVFDKVYFPGVHLPKDGYDLAELDKEVARLESLPIARDYETQELIGIMRLTKYAKTLEGFCEFTAPGDDPFGNRSPVPGGLVNALYEAIHGPPRPGFIPSFDGNHVKGIPGSGVSIVYPGQYVYLARALMHSDATGVPLLNDVPAMQIPGMPDAVPVDNAKTLATILAIECTKLVLPRTPLLRPEGIVEFRAENAALLRGFRRSMLRYAADLNAKIKDLTREDFEAKTRFFIETQIVPTMDELNAVMNDRTRPWHKRAIDGIKLIPEIGGAFITGGPAAAIAKAITGTASQFFVEVAAKGDGEEALKRSGLTYLMRLKAFQERQT
jgi:hypothetical protein